MEYLLIGVFLPLFPFSMLFNRLYAALNRNRFRVLLMLVWPATGLILYFFIMPAAELSQTQTQPQWLGIWAVGTALLYAFRSLVIKDLGIWIAYIWTSTAALIWLLLIATPADLQQVLLAGLLLLPVSLMPLVSAHMTKVFGGSYAGAVNGLLQRMPRLALVLITGLLAAVATPLFPGFFVMLGMLNLWLELLPWLSFGILLLWLLWSWSGMRLMQLFIVGPDHSQMLDDLSQSALLLFISFAGLLALSGSWLAGSLL